MSVVDCRRNVLLFEWKQLSRVLRAVVADCCSDCRNCGGRTHEGSALYSGHPFRGHVTALSGAGREPEAAWSSRHTVCGLCIARNGGHASRHA